MFRNCQETPFPNITENQEQKSIELCSQFNAPFFENVFLTDEFTFQLHRDTIKIRSSKHQPEKFPKFFWEIMLWGALSKKVFLSPYSQRQETRIHSNTAKRLLNSFLMLMGCTLMVGLWNKMKQHP